MWKRSEPARAPKQTMSGDQNQFQSRNFFMINTICRIWRRFPKGQERNGELFNEKNIRASLSILDYATHKWRSKPVTEQEPFSQLTQS